MEARVQFSARSGPADLVLMTPSETRTLSDFFPVNTNNSYVELGLVSYANSYLKVLRNGEYYENETMSLPKFDDENFVYPYHVLHIGFHTWREQRPLVQPGLLPGRT